MFPFVGMLNGIILKVQKVQGQKVFCAYLLEKNYVFLYGQFAFYMNAQIKYFLSGINNLTFWV